MIGRIRIQRCCRLLISARKPGSGRPSQRFLRRRRRFDRGKKVEPRVPRQRAESENISDTGSGFITTINCRPFGLNLRGSYSSFLRPRTARHNERQGPSSPNVEARMTNDELMTKFSLSAGYGALGE